MKTVDYAKIAPNYDREEIRHQIPLDYNLQDYIAAHPQPEYWAVDIACGTGNYLQTQIEHFKGQPIRWHGLDASADMLMRARVKAPHVKYAEGFAEQMPYCNTEMDYISCNFAFHHFFEKETALDEMTRVLKRGGMISMRNAAHEKIPNWWIYRYFPEGRLEDEKRLWSTELLYYELTRRGFKVEIKIDYIMRMMRLDHLTQTARLKIASQFGLISDAVYQIGLNRMQCELDKDPEREIIDEFAMLNLKAIKC